MIRKMTTLVALFSAIWIIPLFLYLLYITGIIGFHHSLFFDDTVSYFIQLLAIVLSISTIYFCLNIFKFKFVIDSITENPTKSLQKYINWNTLRYVWYILIIIINLLVYDTTDTGNTYLALVGALLLSACFCFPSENEYNYITTTKEKNN